MNWLTKQRRFRFGLRTMLVAFFIVALSASAYIAGRKLGAKDAYDLGYARGRQTADDGLKAEAERAKHEWARYADRLVKAEQQIEILKFEAKKKANPTR